MSAKYYIIKKKNADKRATLKAATRRMSWANYYEYAVDHGSSGCFQMKGSSAAMEYLIEDGDEIVELNASGDEIARCTFKD